MLAREIGDAAVCAVSAALASHVANYRHLTGEEAHFLAMARVKATIARAAGDGTAAHAQYELVQAEAMAAMRFLERMTPGEAQVFALDVA